MNATSPERGLVVGGRYRLEQLLGEGGMAVVWRAVHTETDRVVALKLVRRELSLEPQARDLFVREARIAARIGRSDHIVDVLDAGIDDAMGVPFLVMELLDGEPLDERLRREGPLPAELARTVLVQLADALDQAHAAGVIHRDLKPQNLFLTRTKRGELAVKVLDFGIAKIAETAQQSATQIGTPAYAAPEQLGPTWRSLAEKNGRVIHAQVSPATDVWALGIVAYELYTGARSGDFWGATTLAELPVKIVLEPLPHATVRAGARASLLPPGFDAWLARCLDIDATRRWASAGQAVEALFGGGVTAGPVQPSGSAPSLPVAAAAAAGGFGSQPPAPWIQTGAPPIDPILAQWGQVRGAEVRTGGDPRGYLAWHPFQFVPPIGQVRFEARTVVREAPVLIGEITTSDELQLALGEGQFLLALVTCPRFRYRAALKRRQSGRIGDSLSRGLKALDDLMSSQPKAAPSIGDPWFEAHFEVRSPSPQEGHHALPYPLRQLLVQGGFPGVIEMRPGGLVVALLERARFEPATLDQLLSLIDHAIATGPS